jgi:hypothetical protein
VSANCARRLISNAAFTSASRANPHATQTKRLLRRLSAAMCRQRPHVCDEYLASTSTTRRTAFSLFAKQTSKNPKARVEQRPIEASFGRHVAAGFSDRTLRRARHASKIEFFESDDVGAIDDPARGFVQHVASGVRLAFFGPRQALRGSDALCVARIYRSARGVFDRRFVERSRMTRDHSPMLVRKPSIADQLALARGRQDVNAAIDTYDLAGCGQRLRRALALEAGVPAPILLDDPCPPAILGHPAPFAQLDRADARHRDALLPIAGEAQCAITVRELDLLPARRRLVG